jgi:hypothetical protein
MICNYCGNEIDDNAQSCPYCGSTLPVYTASNYAAPAYDDNAPAYDDGYDDGNNYDDNAPAYDDGGEYDSGEYDDGAYQDDEQDYQEKPAKKKHGLSLGGMPNLPVTTIISAACAIFSFICLVVCCSLKADISNSTNTMVSGINQLQTSVSEIEEKISGLDTTVANVQQQAYDQLASQTITITKDLTSLTGPVTLNKSAQMFIVKAEGSLSVNTSFVWQKYNESTGGWVDIVFTGDNTSNSQYGLRLENKAPVDGVYESVLWANGITKAAEGTYRCVVKDTNGITKTSSEAVVTVSDTAE